MVKISLSSCEYQVSYCYCSVSVSKAKIVKSREILSAKDESLERLFLEVIFFLKAGAFHKAENHK